MWCGRGNGGDIWSGRGSGDGIWSGMGSGSGIWSGRGSGVVYGVGGAVRWYMEWEGQSGCCGIGREEAPIVRVGWDFGYIDKGWLGMELERW